MNLGDGYDDDQDAGLKQDDDELTDEISQEDSWQVIRAFFEEKGLVRQQLDSFNEFVSNTMQELVEEVRTLTMEQASQHTNEEGDTAVSSWRDEEERKQGGRRSGRSEMIV